MAIETIHSKLAVLLIDDMPAQQSTLRGQLAMLGISKVDQASNGEDAARMMRSNRYGLVLCDYNLGPKTDGQQLFEYLRENKLLTPDCLFFMVTAESAYASVAAASEHRPDAYLLKPITASEIEERLKASLERRKALAPVSLCLLRNDLAGALAACDTLLERRDRWTMSALQLKGQTLLEMGHHEEALEVYRQALEHRSSLVWAQLGVARAHKAAGRFEAAKDIAREILDSPEGERNVAAFDVLADSLEAQGDTAGAQRALRDAARVVPSARRQRALGECAYRNGELDLARDCLGKVTRMTKGSITAQPQDNLTLAQTLIDLGQAAESLTVLEQMPASRLTANDSVELISHAIRAQAKARQGDAAGAAEALRQARGLARQARADFGTVALAKAMLANGDEAQGLELLGGAISADHENVRVRQLVARALTDTGHPEKIESLVEAAAVRMQERVKDAKALFRDSRIDEALASIAGALEDYPDNTAVLFQAAQMNCLALRLKKRRDPAIVDRVRVLLGRLDGLMPGHDRVAQMKRYYRETLHALAEPAVA